MLFELVARALDLLDNTQVQAILIGPDPTIEARLLDVLEEKANVPILSFSTSLFSHQNPNLVQIAQDETTQFKGIVAMIESFESKNIILICEDTADGMEMASYITIAFHDKKIRITYTSQISTRASHEQIVKELLKIQHMQTTMFVMHTRPSLASRIFSRAKGIGMMGHGYVWIVTSKTTSFLNLMNNDAFESVQGVVGFKSYIPKSRELHKLVSKWRKEYHGSNPLMEFKVVDYNGILAYDAVYALAMAIENMHTKFTSSSILNQMMKINFHGLGGKFKLMNGRIVSNAIEVINVIGKSDRRVGFWNATSEFVKDVGNTNSSPNSGLEDTIFPGGTTSILSRRRMQTKVKKLRIIVPDFGVFPNMIQTVVDPRTNLRTVTGFCGDVFNAAFNALNYGADIEFTMFPYEEGRTYNDLIDKVYFKEYDAAIGDITITSNRYRYVDFTLPFSDMGVGTLTRNAKKSMWIFLDPLSTDLWFTSAGFFFVFGFVIWFIEHRTNEEFQGSTKQQIGTALWFSFSTLVYAHRKLSKSNPNFFKRIELELRSPANYAEDLRSGKVGAIIDEILYVKSVLALYSPTEFSLVTTQTTTNGFAFVFPKDSALTREMSIEIAKLREDGTLKSLEDKWLKHQPLAMSKDLSTPTTNSLDLYGLRGLFFTSALSMALAFLGSIVYLVCEKWQGKSKMEILRCILRRSPEIHAQESDWEPTV
ncbi:hypothetical protein QVD17_34133 [Tagetes erecta]|uniref:Glutamate receptor n=1 Tax=Tagetes erecta TaxID=13708 RepID=A0AAD8JZI4_TARER|nr:hypothetical protein QVD17_34133 [Tagetes erecta]